ncbi:MAG: fasciclin domain-containing protein [Caldilineaceae bacterium]
MMKKIAVISLIACLTLTACAPISPAAAPAAAEPTAAPAEATEAPVAEAKDIVDTAVEAGSFTTLVAAVQAAELVDTLKGEGPFTVFAPSDEAFAKLDKATIDALLADPKGDLTQILLYHVVPGKVMAADVKDGMEATTAQGGTVKFSVKDGKVMINDATIVTTDIEASNGVIHVIDSVIMPPAAEASEAMTTTEASAEPMDIVDTAVAAGSFNTLVAAVQAAELVDTLKGEGPFTVFAPSDEAFAKIDKATLDTLLADPKGALTQILLYHVVPGKVMAADVTDGLEATTAQGGKVKFTVKDGKVMINDATVVTTDIEASNGVIHVIDSVIMPPSQ